MRQTTKYELLQVRLGRDLSTYVAGARKDGRAWRTIAADLTASTGVPITFETLRVWFSDVAA